MKLLPTYEDKEGAARKLVGKTRASSERDAGATIYNLLGEPTWKNLYKLGMYRLPELKYLFLFRDAWRNEELAKHKEIVITLCVVAKNFGISVPAHRL